jgi:hypothetical protein
VGRGAACESGGRRQGRLRVVLFAGLADRLAGSNPSWHIQWDRDHFEGQLEAAGAKLAFPHASPETTLERIRAILLAPEVDRTDHVAEVVRVAHPTAEVEISLLALRDDPLPLSDEVRKQVWEDVVRRWRSERSTVAAR